MPENYISEFFTIYPEIDADILVKLKGLECISIQNSPSTSLLKRSLPNFKPVPFAFSLLVFGTGNKGSEIYAFYFYPEEKSKKLFNRDYCVDIYLSVKSYNGKFCPFTRWGRLISPDGLTVAAELSDTYISRNYCLKCKHYGEENVCVNLQCRECIINRWFYFKNIFRVGFYCQRKLELRESSSTPGYKRPYNPKASTIRQERNDIEVIQKKLSCNIQSSCERKDAAPRAAETLTRKSPSQHYRKGYVRHMANGKVISVRPTIVNKGKTKTITEI